VFPINHCRRLGLKSRSNRDKVITNENDFLSLINRLEMVKFLSMSIKTISLCKIIFDKLKLKNKPKHEKVPVSINSIFNFKYYNC
jgi:hypothetical protein